MTELQQNYRRIVLNVLSANVQFDGYSRVAEVSRWIELDGVSLVRVKIVLQVRCSSGRCEVGTMANKHLTATVTGHEELGDHCPKHFRVLSVQNAQRWA